MRSSRSGGLGTHLPRPLTGSMALRRSFSLSPRLLLGSKREVDQSISRFLWPICFRETSLEKLPAALESELPSDLVLAWRENRDGHPCTGFPREVPHPLFSCGWPGELTSKSLSPAGLAGSQLRSVQAQPDFGWRGTSTLACPTGSRHRDGFGFRVLAPPC